VIQNLRNLWENKKVVENMTQTEAASQLGWTQSAFSHYLTEITALNSTAIIKLANFLEVCPTEIDPNFSGELPRYTNYFCYPETLSGKTPSVNLNRYVNLHAGLISIIEVDKQNEFFPIGSKLGVVRTKDLQTNWVEMGTTNEDAICLIKKNPASKLSVVEVKRKSLKTLPLDKFNQHLTTLYVKIF